MNPAALLHEALGAGIAFELIGDIGLTIRGDAAAIQRLTPALRECKPEIIAILRGADLPSVANCDSHTQIDSARYYRWRVHFVDRDPVEIGCTPEVNHSELLAMYPEALAAEPLPENLVMASPSQEREVRALVEAVARSEAFTHDEACEALEVALRDPDGAIRSFRALVKELGIDSEPDDRRTCRECKHLAGGYCGNGLAAGASRQRFEPDPGALMRCNGFVAHGRELVAVPEPRQAPAKTVKVACESCQAVTRHRACGDPVTAGLSPHDGVIRYHPKAGAGCPAWSEQTPPNGVNWFINVGGG